MDKNAAIIRKAQKEELNIIQHIATAAYGPAYLSILGQAQLDYMLGKIYSREALSGQYDQGHVFLISQLDEVDGGFASYSSADPAQRIYRLHKLYVLPDLQGTGLGGCMVREVVDRVREGGGRTLQLNVNRFNPARGFYERMGFTIKETVNIPIGEGYYMNDYVMELLI